MPIIDRGQIESNAKVLPGARLRHLFWSIPLPDRRASFHRRLRCRSAARIVRELEAA